MGGINQTTVSSNTKKEALTKLAPLTKCPISVPHQKIYLQIVQIKKRSSSSHLGAVIEILNVAEAKLVYDLWLAKGQWSRNPPVLFTYR